ncbi:MAG: N-acetylornithine carbamoyltransferase [Bacteroidota bacterium]
MKHFFSVNNVPDVNALVKRAFELKKEPLKYNHLGKGKSILLIFLNPSLRTRLSTQKAAFNLGLNVSIMDIGKEGWKLEFEDGVVMDSDKAEHIKDAARVMGNYFDIVGIRSFAELKDSELDYAEKTINQFIEYSGVPVVNMESATLHPLQSLTDCITIEEFKTKERPKVVLSWAPHPKALPQAVANSFVQWMTSSDFDLTITHPEGYELDERFTQGVKIEYNQEKAFDNADFIYAKNWSSFNDYGQILSQNPAWMIDAKKMQLTDNARFMHCLPIRRNVIASDEVLDSENSIIIQQAANREYAAQAVLKTILDSM